MKSIQSIMSMAVFLTALLMRHSVCAAENEVYNWKDTFDRGLWLYHQGKAQEAFNIIENAVRNEDPGPEVQHTLVLMRRSFIVLTASPEPVKNWEGSAKQYIHEIESKKDLSVPDTVILCVLKPSAYPPNHSEFGWNTEPLLNRIIQAEPPSPWRDWAFWEKARITGDDAPRRVIKGRNAIAFLKEHPNTYMKRAFALDVYRWRVGESRLHFQNLLEDNDTEDILVREQLPTEWLDQVQQTFAELKRVPITSLQDAQSKLDNRLWGGHRGVPEKRLILEYLRALIETEGKHSVPPEVYEGVMKLDKNE